MNQKMFVRSTRSIVKFYHPFNLNGDPECLPAGEYEVVVEEELLEGLSFLAYRKTATYLVVVGRGLNAGETAMREISENSLESLIGRDRRLQEESQLSDTEHLRQEELK
ncbi:hypothetical protein [Roseibium sp. LAB1]